jgi:MFS family permease
LASQLLPIAALLASTAFLLIANGLHALLLPVRATLEGFSTTEIGLIGAGWAAGFVLGCLYAPHLVQRAGHVRAFGAAAAAAAIVVLLNGMVVAPWPWIGLRVLSGFAIAMAFMIIESWLNERASNESRGTIFAVYMTVTYLGLTVGQLLLMTAEISATTLFMLGAIFFSLAVLPTALSTAASPPPLARVSLDLPRLLENSPIAAFTVLMVGVVNGAFGALAPVFAAAVGLPPSLIAVMMAVAIVMGALAQLPVGRLSDRFDRRHVLAASASGAALAGLAIFLFVPGGGTLVLLTAIYGAFAYVLRWRWRTPTTSPPRTTSLPCPAACCCCTASAPCWGRSRRATSCRRCGPGRSSGLRRSAIWRSPAMPSTAPPAVRRRPRRSAKPLPLSPARGR